MGCQTYSPVQRMADAESQADPPITPTNDASCQTEILISKCETQNKKSQVKFESVKIETDEKVTMTEINLVDIAVQTDKKVKQKRQIKISNNKVHPDNEERETDQPLQTVEDFVETDVPVAHEDFIKTDVPVSHDSPTEQPKKRKKKKKKRGEKYEDDGNNDLPIQHVASYPVEELEKEPELTNEAPPVDRFLSPVERNQPSCEISEDDDNKIDNPEQTRIKKRYRKQRNAIEKAFFASEREQQRFEKYCRKYGHKKRNNQNVSSVV